MNDRGINVIPNLKPFILADHPYIENFDVNQVFIKSHDGSEDYIGRWWGAKVSLSILPIRQQGKFGYKC